jgi:hypothetical protein
LGLGTQGEAEENCQDQIPKRVKQVMVFHTGKYAPFGQRPAMLAETKAANIPAQIIQQLLLICCELSS